MRWRVEYKSREYLCVCSYYDACLEARLDVRGPKEAVVSSLRSDPSCPKDVFLRSFIEITYDSTLEACHRLEEKRK